MGAVYNAAWSSITITGAEITNGLTQSGNIIVDTVGTNTSSYNFVAGISNTELTNGYVIVTDTSTAGVVGRSTGNSTGPSAPANQPTYWVSNGLSNDDFLDLVNALPPTLDGNGFNTPNTTPAGGRPYFDGTAGFDAPAARIWLKNNGYWTNY
jgi:hypothetical protein